MSPVRSKPPRAAHVERARGQALRIEGARTAGHAPKSITVRVPLALRRRGGRKVIIMPHGEPSWMPPPPRLDNAMVKAIARAFRWREMLENGTHGTIAEIAAGERINESYIGRVIRLTLLAPDIVEAILVGRQPPEITLAVLMRPFPVAWCEQRKTNFCWKHAG